MKVIKRNAIRCKICGDIIESRSTHDFQQCSCGATFVDGGHEYVRIGGELDNIEILTEYEEVPSYVIEIKTRYGTYQSYEIRQSRINNMIEYYESVGSYVRVSDDKGVIYETEGYEEFNN